MIESYVAIVLYNQRPSLTAPGVETAVQSLEPDARVSADAGAADDSILLKIDDVLVTVTSRPGTMPEEAAVPSLGMADIPEPDRQRLASHRAHVMLECSDEETNATAMDIMIALLKAGMALCNDGGQALCLPASGLCLLQSDLQNLARQNQAGPRVWGIDESEGDLPGYQKYTLWESLRREAQPAALLVGFVPAEVDGTTWFFSAGHSLFGLPEIAYAEGNIEDFKTVRELFRFIFAFLYQQPEGVHAGRAIRTNDPALAISLEELPPKYADLQSPTGTLQVQLITNGGFNDWESE